MVFKRSFKSLNRKLLVKLTKEKSYYCLNRYVILLTEMGFSQVSYYFNMVLVNLTRTRYNCFVEYDTRMYITNNAYIYIYVKILQSELVSTFIILILTIF